MRVERKDERRRRGNMRRKGEDNTWTFLGGNVDI